MENLNKENFWNELMSRFPDGMKLFCSWVDDYKEKNNWNDLFNYGIPRRKTQGWHNPKFHDIPLAMQIGIFLEFVFENIDKYDIPEETIVNIIAIGDAKLYIARVIEKIDYSSD